MELYLILIPLFLSALSGLIALIVCRTQLAAIQKRLVFVEREVSLARIREERQEQDVQDIFKAVTSLKDDIEELLGGLREKLDLLLVSSVQGRSSQS